MQTTPIRKTVPQACDACRRRKIKCNGLRPCPGCNSAGLTCSYNVSQKKGGNRGARATVLNELRGSSRDGDPDPDINGRAPQALDQHGLTDNGVLERATVDVFIQAYLTQIYPVIPFLDADILRNEADHTVDSALSRQFMIAFCAYVATFGKVSDDVLFQSAHAANPELGKQLLDDALSIQVPDRISSPSPQSIFISFFLYGAYAGLGDYRQGWFYLREATTLFMMQKGEDDPAWFSPSIYRRMFWVLVVSERCVC